MVGANQKGVVPAMGFVCACEADASETCTGVEKDNKSIKSSSGLGPGPCCPVPTHAVGAVMDCDAAMNSRSRWWTSIAARKFAYPGVVGVGGSAAT